MNDFRFEVPLITYSEGIAEGDVREFQKLSKAKSFVKSHKKRFGSFWYSEECSKIILKFNTRTQKYVKRVWLYENGSWHSTRKISKYKTHMEI